MLPCEVLARLEKWGKGKEETKVNSPINLLIGAIVVVVLVIIILRLLRVDALSRAGQDNLSSYELQWVRDYAKRNKNRETLLLGQIYQRINAAS
jgi:hypothetical protein